MIRVVLPLNGGLRPGGQAGGYMRSENMGFTWSKPSNYRKNKRYHACEGRTYRHVKVRQYSALTEFAIDTI